jgi:uncharacterized Zn-finger protein
MNEDPYKCGICHKIFVKLYSLKTHLQRTEEYVCTVRCTNLKAYSLRHTGKKRHKYGICKNGFTFCRNLRAHELIHTGQKPYVCSECRKAIYDLILGHMSVFILVRNPMSVLLVEKDYSSQQFEDT